MSGDDIFQLFAFLLPAVVTGAVAFYFFRLHTRNEDGRRRFLLQKDSQKNALPIRLQAYERMAAHFGGWPVHHTLAYHWARLIELLVEGEPESGRAALLKIAEELDLHESTISRAATNKYMLTPQGVFEFKYFFSSHVGSADGDNHSSTAIRARIRKLIQEEQSGKPLSDNKITALLKQEGISVARRTVAKYREGMNIASSVQRRREKRAFAVANG